MSSTEAVPRCNFTFPKDPMMDARLAVLGTTFVLAVLGNGCVILALLPRWKKLARVHHYMLNLSIADMCVALGMNLTKILELTIDVGVVSVGGNALCKFVSFLGTFPIFASSYILVMTAVDRFIAICYPLKNYSWTNKRTYFTIALAWGIGFLLALPQFFLFSSQYNRKMCMYLCLDIFRSLEEWVVTAYTFYFIGFNFFIPLIVLIIAYGSISYTVAVNVHSKTKPQPRSNGLHKDDSSQIAENSISVISRNTTSEKGNSKSSNNIVPRSHSQRAFSRAKMKTVTLTFVVVCAFVVCWAPHSVMTIWWSLDASLPQKDGAGMALDILQFLTVLNSCTNPYIYIYFNYKGIKRFLLCKNREKRTFQRTRRSSSNVSVSSTSRTTQVSFVAKDETTSM